MKATPDQAERLHRFAHDLRNRLAGIQQVLLQVREAPSDDPSELLVFAEQQYFKALRATEELLDELGVDRGIGRLNTASIDLSRIVQDELEALAHRFERKQQRLVVELPERLLIQGDPQGIAQIVAALLSNASKFSAEGAAVRISLQAKEDMAILTMADEGIGLDDEDLKQVFTRYAWLKGRPTAGEAQGRSTLSRAVQWANAHGGQLEAASGGPGLGSTFTLRLPIGLAH
ncbi:MAG: HAMP domain-containing histidine kinase [Flavobacteriales bacterium]|nr:HAMP domain-containing histidine kinase [Flavobacteriales bacterium]